MEQKYIITFVRCSSIYSFDPTTVHLQTEHIAPVHIDEVCSTQFKPNRSARSIEQNIQYPLILLEMGSILIWPNHNPHLDQKPRPTRIVEGCSTQTINSHLSNHSIDQNISYLLTVLETFYTYLTQPQSKS